MSSNGSFQGLGSVLENAEHLFDEGANRPPRLHGREPDIAYPVGFAYKNEAGYACYRNAVGYVALRNHVDVRLLKKSETQCIMH